MADFFLIVVAALVVAGIVFGVVAFALGREPGLSEPEPDSIAEALPEHPLSADDIDRVRFDVVVRGYRMDQVGALLDRVVGDMRNLQEYVDSLEGELAALRRGSSQPADSTPEVAADAGAGESDVATETPDPADAVEDDDRASDRASASGSA